MLKYNHFLLHIKSRTAQLCKVSHYFTIIWKIILQHSVELLCVLVRGEKEKMVEKRHRKTKTERGKWERPKRKEGEVRGGEEGKGRETYEN